MFKRKKKNDLSDIEAYIEEPILEPVTEEPVLESITEDYIDTYIEDNKIDRETEKTESKKSKKKFKKKNKKKKESKEIEDDYSSYELYEDYEEPNQKEKKYKRTTKIINIIFVLLILIMIMIAVDVISVARYNRGPYFAIRTNILKDGGTKIYYGAGYKVIKYHQTQGRRDIQIGLWNMPYSITPTNVSSIDLAIEFYNKPDKTSKKYYKKFLRVTGQVMSVEKEKNQIILGYDDPDDKYTLQITCQMSQNKNKLSQYKKGDSITVIGTAKNFTLKTKKKSNSLVMSDCFAEKGIDQKETEEK